MTTADQQPTISVVMPTFNRRDQLLRAIEALTTQKVDEPFEIVVVSDGSTDGSTRALRSIESDVPLQIIDQPNGGPASARNRGVAEARGELIAFVDDDLVAGEGLLQAHLDAHRKLGPDVVVIGPMLRPPDLDLQPWVDWEQAMLDKQYAAMEGGAWSATPRQFYTGNASLPRARLLDVGGFDCAFRRAEDVELAYRLDDAGMRFEYLSDAAGYHYAKRSFEAWRSMAYTYGRNDVIFARDRGRDWIFPFMAEKFGQHQAPLRWLISSTVRVPKAGAVLAPALRMLAMASDRLGLPAIARASYSCIYGIEYHGGIADELGSREAFFESVRTGTGPTSS